MKPGKRIHLVGLIILLSACGIEDKNGLSDSSSMGSGGRVLPGV